MVDKIKVLTIDDEQDIRLSIKSILSVEGFEVFEANNGKDGIEKIKKIKPDIVLLDILMPGLTTKDILEEINKLKIKPPIIFLTVVRLSEVTKKNLIKEQMVDYIEKPFDNEDLVKRIKKALKK